jgi:hypothetical protein
VPIQIACPVFTDPTTAQRTQGDPLYLALGRTSLEQEQSYRALFHSRLDDEAAADIRQSLRLGMPVREGRFAEEVCAKLGIRLNTGKRGRSEGEAFREGTPMLEQADFGF